MKLPLAALVALGLLTLGAPCRADYVDEAQDLSPPATEPEPEPEPEPEADHSAYNAVDPDFLSEEREIPEDVTLRQGDALSDVQEVED
jgi:hypothetical protein